MDDIAVPTLSSFLSNLDSSESVLVANSVDAQSPLMTQRSDSSEEEKAGAGTLQNKKKRSQFTSCDACRLRKVRCIREAAQLECNSCISKNIACTRIFSQTHAHGKGKRINQAREQFGTNPSMSGSQSCSTSSSTSPFTPLQSVTVYKMNEHVLSAKALSAFLHAYETDVASAIPALEYARLFGACRDVDFDINRVDELDRILCIAAAAVTASVQQADRKFGVGQSAITIKEPLATKRDLETRVMEEADRLGILRKPSMRALETLRLFCILSSGEAARQCRRSDSYRAYEQALVEHMRSLSDSGQISEQKVAEYFWSIILGDSFAAALSGRSPSFSQEDIENFASYVDYSTEGMLMIINYMDSTSPDAGFGLIFASICQICRSFYARVTSTRARKRPFVDVEMMQEIPAELERINMVTQVCEQKLDSMFGKGSWPEPLGYWGRIVHFLHTFIMVMATDELEAAIIKELSGNASLHRLQTLQETMDKLQLQTMAELSKNMGWEPRPGSARIFATVDGLLAFFSVLRMRRLFKLPAVEEGGCTGSWTIQEKVANARYYMKVCEYLGCAVLEIAEELPNLRSQLTLLEQRAKTLSEQVTNVSWPGTELGQSTKNIAIWGEQFPSYRVFTTTVNEPGSSAIHTPFENTRKEPCPTREAPFTERPAEVQGTGIPSEGINELEASDSLGDPWNLDLSSTFPTALDSILADAQQLDANYQQFLASLGC